MKPEQNRVKKGYARDILLAAGLLLTGLVIFGIVWLFSGQGDVVQVRIGGRVTAEYSLNENRTVTIEGTGGTNLLRIQDGEAWMEKADCPDGLCVRIGRISRQGQSIICLPHQVVVEITGAGTGQDRSEIDVIVK